VNMSASPSTSKRLGRTAERCLASHRDPDLHLVSHSRHRCWRSQNEIKVMILMKSLLRRREKTKKVNTTEKERMQENISHTMYTSRGFPREYDQEPLKQLLYMLIPLILFARIVPCSS
jgi:hypothetical protein